MSTQVDLVSNAASIRTNPLTRTVDGPSLDQIRGNTDGWCLRQGHQGDSVLEMKAMLREAGFDVPAGNTVDADTDRAIRSFQAAHGLVVDGKVGVNTLGALERLRANPELADASAQAGARRTVGEDERALAPTQRGPLTDGAYINPATGQLVRARSASDPAAMDALRAGFSADQLDQAGHPLMTAGAIAAARVARTPGAPSAAEAAAAAAKPRLVGADGEPLREQPTAPKVKPKLVDQNGEVIGKKAAAPKAAEPKQLVFENGEVIGEGAPKAAGKIKLLDEAGQPLNFKATRTGGPVQLVGADGQVLGAKPRFAKGEVQILGADGEAINARPTKPAPKPQLVDQNGEALKRDAPAPRKTAEKAEAAPQAAGKRTIQNGDGVDRLYRDTVNQSLAEQHTGVRLEKGQTLQDLVDQGKLTGGQKKAAQSAFESLKTDDAYRNAANQALKKQGSAAELKQGETLKDLFDRGEIDQSTLKAARETAYDSGFAKAVEHEAGGAGKAAQVAKGAERGWLESAASKGKGLADAVKGAEFSPAAASLLKGGGHVVMAGAVALDAIDVADAAHRDTVRGDGKHTEAIKTGSKVAGGWAGAIGGAALVGAAAGTIVPGLGNVAGFLIGAAGGAVGYWLGSSAGEAVGTAITR